MGLLDKLFMRNKSKKVAENAVNNLISVLPPLTSEQQRELDEKIEREKNAPPTKIIRETLNIDDTKSEYDFNNILVIDEKRNNLKRYLLENDNQKVACKDLNVLLDLLKKTMSENNIQLDFEIDNSLNFSHKNYGKRGGIDFAFLKYAPFTNTGKNAKYPIELNIQNKLNEFNINKDDLIHGEICYLQNGEVGKSRLITSHNHIFYVFHFAIKNKIFIVTKIEKSSILDGSKETLYHFNP